MRQHHKRRKAHQDTLTDPFEGLGTGWDDLDSIAEDFTWATAAPSRRPRNKERGS